MPAPTGSFKDLATRKAPDDNEVIYPLVATTAAHPELHKNYKDKAAAALYKESGASKFAGAHARMSRALEKQSKKLEEYHNTPFTEQNVQLMSATIDSLDRMERLLERWHLLIYPNQRPEEN